MQRKDNDNTLTIRQMRKQFGVTARTLRFYESKELLFPIRNGQTRLFTKRDRARLKLILRGKRFGFSLEEIRQLLELYNIDDAQTTQINEAMKIAQKRLIELQAKRVEIDQAIDDLKTQMRWGEQMIASSKKNTMN